VLAGVEDTPRTAIIRKGHGTRARLVPNPLLSLRFAASRCVEHMKPNQSLSTALTEEKSVSEGLIHVVGAIAANGFESLPEHHLYL
jgi:hypothetical protein